MDKLQQYLPQSISGKSILITGGTTGIGRATALLLADCGANIMIFGRHQHEVDATLQALRAGGRTTGIYGISADVAKPGDIDRVFEQVDQQLGTLDILINNAALGYGSITEGTYEDWQYILSTNLMGYLACSRYAIDRMKDSSGHIVNIGSMSADVREETSSLYVATKSAIQGFSESLRKEVNSRGIKITLIEPGAVVTDMQELSPQEEVQNVEALEMMTPLDIAVAVLYCLSQPKRCDVVDLKIRPHLQLI